MSDLAKRLRIKAGMIEMGERIAWGSDSALMREAADALGHVAGERKMVGRPQIREVFMRNGARIEPDRDDLPDWVYESVFELLEMAAPDVQREPVGWMVTSIRPDFDKPIKALHSVQMLADEQQRHWEGRGCLVYQTPLYTDPQPAEQPDVARLVEALRPIACFR